MVEHFPEIKIEFLRLKNYIEFQQEKFKIGIMGPTSRDSNSPNTYYYKYLQPSGSHGRPRICYCYTEFSGTPVGKLCEIHQ